VRHVSIPFAASVLLALISSPALGAYRCIDAAGKVSYMQRPCESYGLKMSREVRDPPKGDGTMRILPSGQSIGASSSEHRARNKSDMVPMQCGVERISCLPGDTVICGGERRVCDSD
jgi:hypothetical protein